MAEALYISDTEFRAGAGKFDARKRYLRAGNTLSSFPLCSAKTVDFNRVAGGSGIPYSTLRYSVDGYVRQSTTYKNFGGDTGGISAGSYNAPFVKVTT
jgi:hypothetical protein